MEWTVDLTIIPRDLMQRSKLSICEVLSGQDSLVSPFIGECDGCGQHGQVFHCQRCRRSAFCGAACQKSNWPDHRRICKIYRLALDVKWLMDLADKEYAEAMSTRQPRAFRERLRAAVGGYKAAMTLGHTNLNHNVQRSVNPIIVEKDKNIRLLMGRCLSALAACSVYLKGYARARKWWMEAKIIAMDVDDQVGHELCEKVALYIPPEKAEYTPIPGSIPLGGGDSKGATKGKEPTVVVQKNVALMARRKVFFSSTL